MGCFRPALENKAKEASKNYHGAIRRQKKRHWEEVLADDTNIWKAAKYLTPANDSMSSKVPALAKADGSIASDNTEQQAELIHTFLRKEVDHKEKIYPCGI